ncbi:hypothetical protein BM1_00688 [Bipolaris maydis]|nr:hypothetical protein BM1_00688 [Bipolaris maydis]
MAPPFVPEDEQLLLFIRNTIKNHRKGTWENTTKLYSILVPSRVQRTQDSLENRSMYAAEYPYLAIRKSSDTRARTQTAGARSKNSRDRRNTSMRCAEPRQTRSKGQSSSKDGHNNYPPSVMMSMVSKTVSRPSGSAHLPNFEVDNFACLTSEILLRLDMLDQELRRQYSRMKEKRWSPSVTEESLGKCSSQQAIPEQPYSISEEEHLLQMKDEEEEEEQCFHGESDMVALDAALEHDENTEWLRGCEWPAWFAHKPIHIIDAAAALPSARTSEDLVMSIPSSRKTPCTGKYAGYFDFEPISLYAHRQTFEKFSKLALKAPNTKNALSDGRTAVLRYT